MVDNYNEFTGDREPALSDDSDVHVTVKHDFSETFEREKFDCKIVGKGEWHNLVDRSFKPYPRNVF